MDNALSAAPVHQFRSGSWPVKCRRGLKLKVTCGPYTKDQGGIFHLPTKLKIKVKYINVQNNFFNPYQQISGVDHPGLGLLPWVDEVAGSRASGGHAVSTYLAAEM